MLDCCHALRREGARPAAAGQHSQLALGHGRVMPPRPLHHQLVLGREIVITERMDIHLVSTTGRMFLKPIPRFLLEPQLWTKYLSCGGDCGCSSNKDDAQGCTQELGRGIRQRVLGFLFSYAALISHESDFRIAKENRLLPPEISWPGWRIFVERLDTELIYPHIDPRFHSELRLNRLSKIYCLWQNLLLGYLPHCNQYIDFVHDKFILLSSSDATRRYAHRDAGRARHRPRIYPQQQTA
ncbi:hypothetical protein B0J13DRAFT_608531 [Dactylonectria estremocensis]|uniref:Uncharacterized protein n=1 Tax=Dactylonectria estremocensis TaxID=1079267 RepID=A0A9P9EQJ8_9HYPO|nr:hypothetical protein B0J13DRAFT_608531 [Dactylonectria estremocensis]